ncbi:MAG: hypothetical protein Tsb009_00710 [Planctomycetaceae bacterium]
MGSIFRALLKIPFVRPILRPITRFLFGMVAIPIFRLFLRHVVRLQNMDQELEKDLEQWFRGALLLLAATANMENALFGWVPLDLQDDDAWIGVSLRLLLAVGVIEAMPDQELFAVIHPGPPKIRLRHFFTEIREKFKPLVRGIICQHLNRSSPVFVIMAAIFTGPIGWVCYGIALLQYLIIGLVTSRDRAMDVLGEFDRQVAIRRKQIVEEFHLKENRPDQQNEKSADSSASGEGHGTSDAADRESEPEPSSPEMEISSPASASEKS